MAHLEQAPVEIRKGLYLGGISALQSISDLGITHVVSVINNHADVCTLMRKLSRTHMVIDVCDDNDANLLQHFDKAVQFIQNALAAKGRVLVHCHAGVSRSASVVIAFLMAVELTNSATALASLQTIYPMACPNDAFLQQLQLWHEMGYVFDAKHPGYSTLNMQQLAEQHFAGQQIEPNNLPAPSQNEQGQVFRCRKCRRLVASQSNVVAVNKGPGNIAFKHKHRAKRCGEQSEDAGSLWVEPMQWMEELSQGATQGKLYCPSCKARLGSYNWAGSQSESGAWVTPAFQLHHSKIDAMNAQAALPVGLRRPLFGSTIQQQSGSDLGQAQSSAREKILHSGSATPFTSGHVATTDPVTVSPDRDEIVPMIDAARTVSEAGHVAAQIDSDLERPGAAPVI